MNSAVSLVESTRPATRLLDDAFAIAVDEAVPEDVKRSAIPALCREALEDTAWDVYSAKAFAGGQSREQVENAWENATKTAKRLALALAGNADDTVAVDKWKWGTASASFRYRTPWGSPATGPHFVHPPHHHHRPPLLGELPDDYED